MKRTIIYVFGPKRLASLYFANKELEQKSGGWLKIGQTSSSDDGMDKRDVAINRINQETKTGIPEVCQLFDVFEYPEQQGNTDDKIRNILTDDIYNLECSRTHNKEIEKYEIKAGREFVYGVTRNQVFNAVAKFERDIILSEYGNEGFDALMELIKKNNTDVSPFENGEDADANAIIPTTDSEFSDKLWYAVIEKIRDHVHTHINKPVGRPYLGFKSPTHDSFDYCMSYSVRYGLTNIAIRTHSGENPKQKMIEYIAANEDIRSQFPNLIMEQGAKNKDKWSWIISDTLDKPFNELVDWFATTFLTFYKTFENEGESTTSCPC